MDGRSSHQGNLDQSCICFNARSLSSKVDKLKTVIYVEKQNIVTMTENWSKSLSFGGSSVSRSIMYSDIQRRWHGTVSQLMHFFNIERGYPQTQMKTYG